MKPVKIVAILIIAAAVLTTAYLAISHKKKKENVESSSFSSVSIFNFNSNNISDLIINNSDGDFSFKYDGSDWSLTSSEQFSINPFLLNDIVTAMSTLTSESIVTESADDLSIYGLDKPSKITCITSDSTEYSLEIGKSAIAGDGYYVKKQGENAVYMISSENGLKFSTAKTDLKDTYLFYALLNDVTDIKLEKNSNIVYNVEKDSGGSWTMSKPISTSRTNIANISGMIDEIIRVNIAEYVAENLKESEYSQYGLDNPQYVFEISTDAKSEKILFGTLDEESNKIYALLESSGDVVKFNMSDLEFLEKNAEHLLIETIHTENIYDVSQVDILYNGESIKLTMDARSDDMNNAQYTYNGTDIDALGNDAKDLFIDFYSSLVGVYMDHVEADAQPSGDAAIEFTYTRKSDPTTVEVSFIQQSDNTFYAMIDGKYTGYIVRLKAFYDDGGFVKTRQALTDFFNFES